MQTRILRWVVHCKTVAATETLDWTDAAVLAKLIEKMRKETRTQMKKINIREKLNCRSKRLIVEIGWG